MPLLGEEIEVECDRFLFLREANHDDSRVGDGEFVAVALTQEGHFGRASPKRQEDIIGFECIAEDFFSIAAASQGTPMVGEAVGGEVLDSDIKVFKWHILAAAIDALPSKDERLERGEREGFLRFERTESKIVLRP